MQLHRSTLWSRPRENGGEVKRDSQRRSPRQGSCYWIYSFLGIVETRLLALNSDPVFQDCALAILGEMSGLETQVVRNLSEAVQALLEENFDGLIIEGDSALAVEQATNLRQHFPSLTIACLLQSGRRSDVSLRAKEQNIELLSGARSDRRLGAT